MRWAGERSYGIYLIHLGLMDHLLRHIGPDHGPSVTFGALTFSSLVATLILADLLWRFVERPALERRLPWRDVEFVRRPRRSTA
jgi:peptidoglycan/LPS O-acetylase OafA/YrhL